MGVGVYLAETREVEILTIAHLLLELLLQPIRIKTPIKDEEGEWDLFAKVF